MSPWFKVKKSIIPIISVLLCVACLSCCTSNTVQTATTENRQIIISSNTAKKPDTSEISAKSAIVIEASEGTVVWSKNCDERLPMASTTKIMTAVVALENSDINTVVKIPREATGIEGSSIYLYEGEELTLESLLYALLLSSANDAAVAIAIYVGGSLENFVTMMNDKALSLGLSNTHFDNPHGLDSPEHYTTAAELALITRYAMQNPTFCKMVSTPKITIPLNKTAGVRLLINHNKLLKTYNGATGVKTGFTKRSGRCLVSSATSDGVDFICVTLSAPSDWNDHKILLDFASSLYERIVVYNALEFTYSLPIVGAEKDLVAVSNRDELSAIVPRNCDNLRCVTELPRFVFGGVNKDDVVGSLVLYVGETEILRVPLTATETVPQKTKKFSLWSFFNHFKK